MSKTFLPNMTFRKEDGKRYEDTYGGWLALLQQIADAGGCGMSDAPMSWYPFIRYLGGEVDELHREFPEDYFVPDDIRDRVHIAISKGRLRELVEHHSTLRPELADALYKSDVEWVLGVRLHAMQSKFNVTCNGSFYRPEIREYSKILGEYEPPDHITGCVIVPCAADKPYPAPLHRAIQTFLPANVHLIIATGVLGVVPEELWDDMPEYDSGIPNKWRVMKAVEHYFTRHQERYSSVVVYSDFYNEAIDRGLESARVRFSTTVNEWVDSYLDLMEPKRLQLLKDVFKS